MERQIVKIKKWFIDLVWVTTGVALVALGLVMFLVPNKIAAGGVSGAAVGGRSGEQGVGTPA